MNSKDLKSFVLTVLLTFFLAWFFVRPISEGFSFIYSFTGKIFNQVGSEISESKEEVGDYIDSLERIKELEIENKRIKLENIKLNSFAKRKKYEEQAQMNYASLKIPSIKADVIGRSPDNWHEQIIISRGKKDGVRLGSGVFSLNGIIGQVTKVNESSSIVKLIFDRSFRIGAKVVRTGEYGVITGAYPDFASLEFIKIDSQIKEGDMIVSSGLCLSSDSCPYPNDFPIGKVVKVKKDPNIVGLVVKIEFFEKLNRIKEIYVVN